MVSFTPGGALVLIEQEARLVWTARKEKSVLLLPGFEARIVQLLAWSLYWLRSDCKEGVFFCDSADSDGSVKRQIWLIHNAKLNFTSAMFVWYYAV